jgi:hypothetical protein
MADDQDYGDDLDAAIEMFEAFILGCRDASAVPLGPLLAGGHVAITAMIVAEYGERTAAECLEMAARGIRARQAKAQLELAAMPIAGRA